MKKIFLLIFLVSMNFIHAQDSTKNENKSSIVLRCQVIDSETKTPIPYASIFLEKLEIYRIADENGRFEIKITNEIKETFEVIISSMGFKSKAISISKLKSKIELTPKFEELDEVIISSQVKPENILEKAISLVSTNHPTNPYNSNRYSKALINQNDLTILNLELITKDYDDGYKSPFRIIHRVEEVKWNNNKYKNRYKFTSDIFTHLENPIRFSPILNKKKYKKFKLEFIKPLNHKEERFYIIEFTIDKSNWRYTNRSYPTIYKGRVHIHKESFAIIKVIENWETTLQKKDISKYLNKIRYSEHLGEKYYEDKKILKIKEEKISDFLKLKNEKHYASTFYSSYYRETIDNDDRLENYYSQSNSYLYGYETGKVEKINYDWKKKKEMSLNRIKYNKTFWDSFNFKEKSIID